MGSPEIISARRNISTRSWIYTGIGLLALALVAINVQFVYVAVTSDTGCAETTTTELHDGRFRKLQPAKKSC